GSGYDFVWIADNGTISYKYSDPSGNINTIPVYTYTFNSSGGLELSAVGGASGSGSVTMVESDPGTPGGNLTNDIAAELFGTWKDNIDGTTLTITFSETGITWGGTAGSTLNSTTSMYQGTGYTFVWIANNGTISYKYSDPSGNINTMPVYTYALNSSGELELSVPEYGYVFATLVKGGSTPGGGLTNDIDEELFGTWRDNLDGTTLTIAFSEDGITWGGTAGDSLNNTTSMYQGTGYTFVWVANNGVIFYKYSYNNGTPKSTPAVYTYALNSSGELELSGSGYLIATLVKTGTGAGTVAPPTANPSAGEVAYGTPVTLSTTTIDAEIWYTTDESTPVISTTSTVLYTSPIIVTVATTIKAIAVKDGINSEILEAAYTIGNIIAEGSTLAQKMSWIQSNAESNTTYIVEVSAADEDVVPGSNTVLSYSGKENIVIHLKSSDENNKNINLFSNGSLFEVNSGVTLILDKNITLKGIAGNDASLVQVGYGGSLIMKEGSTITGNNTSSYGGGGVSVYDGTFKMNGGTISNNTAANGGGVFIQGTFEMNGGTISNNTATSSGGGVSVYTWGTFKMNGGTISNNTNGGVSVYVMGGSFIMNDGTISNNTAADGGGVYVWGSTFKMNGGTISNNTATSCGGGVYVAGAGGTFEMNDGIIYGIDNTTFQNTSGWEGNAVHVNGTALYGDGTSIYTSDTTIYGRK
ncbi:MAG: chitobiase/beta-hexosaminidase C-terminal domain-containing protein, partial [Leptospirales bacterium]|nr:chitobiase/beta-hexosaminidase C-terminal domain-containing protein [Leptospirales bacterium]